VEVLFLDLKRVLRSYGLLVLIAGVIILIDQLSKAYIRANFIEGVDMWAPWNWMLPYARILYVSNTGAAFGMLKGMGGVFTILAILVSLANIYYFPRVSEKDWALRLAMGLQLAGALGNLIDRVVYGNVTDFISVGNFPVFNIADASITIGVIVLILSMWVQERREEKAADGKEAAAPEAADVESHPRDGQSS
jgi:signal peptidase II